MGEIEKMDAFSLVVKYLEAGNEATAEKILQIIVRAMKEEKKFNKNSSSIRIENARDAEFLRELYFKIAE